MLGRYAMLTGKAFTAQDIRFGAGDNFEFVWMRGRIGAVDIGSAFSQANNRRGQNVIRSHYPSPRPLPEKTPSRRRCSRCSV
jgi:hypothetical protein